MAGRVLVELCLAHPEHKLHGQVRVTACCKADLLDSCRTFRRSLESTTHLAHSTGMVLAVLQVYK
jgi:hypothetical protein